MPMPQPGRFGSEGLIVATSNWGFAFASIIFGGGGGSGIAQAVVGVAFTRVNGSGWPLTPCAVNGVAVAAERPVVGPVQRRDIDFDSLTARFNRLRLERGRVLIDAVELGCEFVFVGPLDFYDDAQLAIRRLWDFQTALPGSVETLREQSACGRDQCRNTANQSSHW